MREKKVVSIEDRIPKLKKARKKKANRRLIFYISIFFVLIAMVVYLQSSLSHVQHVKVLGNHYISEQEIIKRSEVTSEDSFWAVKKSAVEDKILSHKEVKDVVVEKNFPTTISIRIEELQRVGYVNKGDVYYPLLENGELLTSVELESINGDAPLLVGFDKQIYLEEMTKELAKLPVSINNLISEIHWKQSEGNPYKIWVFMNDGYEVEGSIRNFSKSMNVYPSITAQIDNGKTGVIKMGIDGAVFEPYQVETSTEIENEENNNEIEG